MAGVIKEEIEDIRFLGSVYADVQRGFNECDYTDRMQAFFPVLEGTHGDRMRAQTDPVGQAWPALAASTIRRKGHDRILFHTGRLRASLIGKTADTVQEVSDRGRGMLFGSRVPYSHYHERGGRNLPQRKHVGMTDDTAQVLVDAVADESVESLKIRL